MTKRVALLWITMTTGGPLVAPSLGAQAARTTGRVAGTVLDSATKLPIVGVRVFVGLGSDRSAITDSAGAYRLGAPLGTQILIARRLGYAAVRRSVVIDSAAEVRVDLLLTAARIELEAVVVTATSARNRTGGGMVVVDMASSSVVATASGAVAGLVARIKGTGDATPILGSSKPLVYVDGILVNPGVPAGDSTASAVQRIYALRDLNPEDIESIEVIKGPAASALYGSRAAGGVVVAHTMKGSATGRFLPEASPNTPRSECTGDKTMLVFIHGALGDSLESWKNDSARQSLPEMLRSEASFAHAAVFFLGYRSPIMSSADNIERVAQSDLTKLTDKLVFRDYNSVFLIAHSMGGLVAQRIVNILNLGRNDDALRRIKAVVTLSTPANGARLADAATYISNNPQFRDMKPLDFNSWLQSLQADLLLTRLTLDSLGLARPRFFVAYESEDTPVRKWGITVGHVRVVSRLYASSVVMDNVPVSLPGDHIQIAKPISRSSDTYRWVEARLRSLRPKGCPET